jgi:chromosome segregation ATPase
MSLSSITLVPVFFVIILTFSACDTTGDPREGGIFWSQNKANQRLETKRAEMHHVQQETITEEAEGASLRARRSAVRSSLERQQGELRQLEGEIAALQRQNIDEPQATEALEADVARLEQQRAALSADRSLSVSEMEHQLEELRAEVARLKERKRRLLESR